MSETNDFKPLNEPLRRLLAGMRENLERDPTPQPPPRREACARCQGKRYQIVRDGGRARGRLCDCDTRCSRCQGRGFTLDQRGGYQFHKSCECRSLEERLAAFNAANLPALFAEKTLANFSVHPAGPAWETMAKLKRTIEDFALTARPGSGMKGIGLIGAPGRGKTHLLTAALGLMTLERGLDCRYVEISLLFADLKAAISDPSARAGVDKVDELADVDVLAIDELGKGRGSVFEEEVLDELIGRRYNAGKLTLFASNYPLEAPRGEGRSGAFGQSLRARVGERVFSRLHQMVDFWQIPDVVLDYRTGAPGPR